MGQGVTHMTVINATSAQATVSANIHGVAQDTHEQHVITLHPQQSSLLSLTRQAAGDFRVDWSINFANGTHAEWRDNLPPMQQSKTMLLGNAQVTIDGQNVAQVRRGAGSRRPPAAGHGGRGYKEPVDVPAAMLPKGRVIRLRSYKTGKEVQILEDGNVRAAGGKGPLTRLVVDPSPNGYLRLRSERFPRHFLALKGRAGAGGRLCELRVQMVGPNRYILRSPDLAHGLGFRADGELKNPGEVGKGEGASFTIEFADVQHPHGTGPHAPAGHPPRPHAPPPARGPFAPPAGSYPPQPAPGARPPRPHAPPPAHAPKPGMHPLLQAGQMVRLQVKKTGKFARINAQDQIDGIGGTGPLTRFRVNPSPKGYLRFESVKFPGRFLSLKGVPGGGGPFTELVAHPAGSPNEFHFRSADDTSGLGFKPDGTAKPAANVGRGPGGTFAVVPAQ